MTAPLLLALVGLLVYANSFAGAFLLDDFRFIADVVTHHSVWASVLKTTRPLTHLSFALTRALPGHALWGDHVVNLAIHLGAALALYALVRRTLQAERLRAEWGHRADGIALAIALLWMVHPLQTESVTYLIQRAELLAGLCAVLTLYALLRGVARPPWHRLAVAACALGMLSKPVAAAIPLLAAAYDRYLLAGSWTRMWRARRTLHLALAATWLLLGPVLWLGRAEYAASAGWTQRIMDPFTYLLTQPGVLLHYLRLSVWPMGLCLDYYDWPRATLASAWPTLLLLIGLLAGTLWALRRKPAAGFVGLWTWVLLAPTSVVPMIDLAFEHRMYLPLAGVIALIVCAADSGLRRVPGVRLPRALACAALAAAVGALGLATVRRNAVYRSELAMWQDVVGKRPRNARAHSNLSVALGHAGRLEEAASHAARAIALEPGYIDAHYNLGLARFRQGRFEDAIAHYRDALRLSPHDPELRNNLTAARNLAEAAPR